MTPTAMPPTALAPLPLQRARLQAELLAAYDELIPRMAWDRTRIRDHQRERLRLLLQHAAEHSPFHAERLAGVDLDAVDPEDLTALPVMTKADLMGRFDDVVTDRRMTLAAAEEALAGAGEEAAIVHGSALVLTSGGTSGPRGVFLHDMSTSVSFVGALSRGLMARLRATGVPPGGLRIAIVAAGSPVHATGAASWLTADGGMPFRFLPVPVTLPLAEIVDRLNAMSPMALYGYPTMLARLAEEQRAGRLRITPAMVTCTSETLTAELRSAIRSGFGVPVSDTYGSTEGLVGGSLPDDDVLVFAEDGCIIEPVDADDRPVPPGTPSDAVLVTVLENRLQPLIRFRMTDVFVVQPPAPGNGYLRARVVGRSDEVLRFGGLDLHPLVIRSALLHWPAVVDYHVRQTETGLAVSVLTSRAVDPAELGRDLSDAVARAGLPSLEVTVQEVTELPRDPRTGKLRRFVPLR
jgi:phenylacetate-coenzyme A ligase PaaK-like adenylate-forming protein